MVKEYAEKPKIIISLDEYTRLKDIESEYNDSKFLIDKVRFSYEAEINHLKQQLKKYKKNNG